MSSPHAFISLRNTGNIIKVCSVGLHSVENNCTEPSHLIRWLLKNKKKITSSEWTWRFCFSWCLTSLPSATQIKDILVTEQNITQLVITLSWQRKKWLKGCRENKHNNQQKHPSVSKHHWTTHRRWWKNGASEAAAFHGGD